MKIIDLSEALTADEQKQFDDLNKQRTAFQNANTEMAKQLAADPKRIELKVPMKQMADNLAKVGAQISPLEQKRNAVVGSDAKPEVASAPKPLTATQTANIDKIKKIQGVLQSKNIPLGPTGADGKIGQFTLDGILSLIGTPAPAAPAPVEPAVVSTESGDNELPMLTPEPSLARIIQLSR